MPSKSTNRFCSRVSLVLLCGILSVGCAHKMEISPDRPTAAVRFVSTASLARYVSSYEDERCTASKSSGLLGITGGLLFGETSELKMLDTPPKSGRVFERRLPADKPLVFSWLLLVGEVGPVGGTVGMVGTSAASCSATFRVDLLPGEQYESLYDDANGNCRITFVKLSKAADGSTVREPERTFTPLPKLCAQL